MVTNIKTHKREMCRGRFWSNKFKKRMSSSNSFLKGSWVYVEEEAERLRARGVGCLQGNSIPQIRQD